MNVPQIRGSVITNQAESHVALAGIHIDFSLIKVEPPSEYRDIGRSLSSRRKNEADDGQSHLTAAQLGLLFGGIVPKVPNLISAYGLRCSEIANSPTFNPRGTSQHGLFANEVGADGTAVWAAATSGDSAIAVHLLGCMLSRIWDPPEAISIWMQLIAERKQTLEASRDPFEQAISKNASLSREQIASWHTSIQAWRLTADDANARRQNQLLLIINNLGIPVNTKLYLSDSVVDAWVTAMVMVDKLVSGNPQSVQTGAPLLGLAAWHLYPDMIIFGHGRSGKATDVFQDDPFIQSGGVLTLGIQDVRRRGDGIYWSLPLTHLRYYGQPAHPEARLSSTTSRVSVNDFGYVAFGSLIRRWCADANDIELVAKFFTRLDVYIDQSGNQRREGGWLSFLESYASSFLSSDAQAKADKLQLIKCGRRRYPLFIDDPAADTIFGLSAPSTLLGLLPRNSSRVALLRHIAKDLSDDHSMMVIQCKVDSTNSLWELSSVEKLPSIRKRAYDYEQDGKTNTPKRYIRWLNRLHQDPDNLHAQSDSDIVRLDVPIPCLWAPHGYLWKHAPRSFYVNLLWAKSQEFDWHFAKDVTIRSILAFGNPDSAAIYCIDINYWTSFSPNIAPQLVRSPPCRQLPNILVIRHVLWALENKLPNKDHLFTYLEQGQFSTTLLRSLKALQSMVTLYDNLDNATLELRTAEQPLFEQQWIPEDRYDKRRYHFAGFELTREQKFACIAKFDSGSFNFPPSAMKGVLAISSGNSIYVARCLLQDPTYRQSATHIERVVGNLGKTGMALLVSPALPEVRSLSDDVRLVNHHPFDMSEEDCFTHTSLHLSYTDWQLPIDVGSRGKRDVEAFYIEAAISVHDRGKWVADVNILDIFNHRLSRIIPDCTQHHGSTASRDETCKFVAIDGWEELLDSPTEVGVVRARGNWQARLAAAAVAIQRGHETRIIPGQACWWCCLTMEKLARQDNQKDDDAHVYVDDKRIYYPSTSDEEASDSDMDDIERIKRFIARSNRKIAVVEEHKVLRDDASNEAVDRNIIYIL